ncbi:hypothetical protein DOE73_09915 [Paenibacillus dendritiformis]|nr:hypothetical protein DOE73_09915 [Paenibacillus dendritiformis]
MAIIAIIENPLHTGWSDNKPRQYKQKFKNAQSLDEYVNHPGRTHLNIVEIRKVAEHDSLPFTTA